MVPVVLNQKHNLITIRGAFTREECAELVAFAENVGFSDAPINTFFGPTVVPEVRNNTRVMVDDPERASGLWKRLSTSVPTSIGRWNAVGLNERLRFYRYEPGQQFAWHYDGAFERPNGEWSKLTLMVYLNDDFDGGDTELDVDEGHIVVRPETGMVLLFDHPIRHQGAPVLRGRKYVLRTDVMFERARKSAP